MEVRARAMLQKQGGGGRREWGRRKEKERISVIRMSRQTAVAAHLRSDQLLLFAFARNLSQVCKTRSYHFYSFPF